MEPTQFDKDDVLYKKAKDKIKEIRGFYFNLASFCFCIPIIIYCNLRYMPEFHWFWFSLVGWGTGLLVQGMFAFDRVPFLGRDWENRKLNQLMEQARKKEEEDFTIKSTHHESH